jgi:hypothetical protein
LLQENTLKEEAMTLLISIEEATSRLSRINKFVIAFENRKSTIRKTDTVALLPVLEKVKALNEDFILDKNIELVDKRLQN